MNTQLETYTRGAMSPTDADLSNSAAWGTPDTLPLGDGHMPVITDVIAKGELPVIDVGAFTREVRVNPFRALVTEVLNLHPNPLHVEQRGGIRVYLTNPRRNAERKLVKAHGFRQVKKARQVARYILREQAARGEA